MIKWVRNIKFGFTGGLAIVVLATLVFFWAVDPGLRPVSQSEAVSYFAVLMTLFAAMVAYSGVLRQIGHQQEVEDQRRKAELEAERAALPLALSRICEISRRGIQDVIGHDEVHQPLAPESLSLEATHTESIKAVIKMSNSQVRPRLQAILRGYQVALANRDRELGDPLSKFPDRQSSGGYERIHLCYRWALLYVLAESLFDFARGGEAEIFDALPIGRVSLVVELAGIDPRSYTDFEKTLRQIGCRDSERPLRELFLRP